MAILMIVDDNLTTAEWVRIRSSRCVIGRDEGDVKIPHDPSMSRRHAEIILQHEARGYRWYLRDLQSTNGTFILADKVRLKQGDELIIGSRRFRFELRRTKKSNGRDDAALIELSDSPTQRIVELTGDEVLLGRDPARCPPCLADDLALEPAHARLTRNSATDQWWIRRLESLNGLWIRINRIRLSENCWFILGEQRFRFALP